MRLASLLALLLAGCAGFSGHGLVPGRSTESEVEALMGPAADVRKAGNGDTLRYYSREPYGREIYAARIGRDGKLASLTQTLTDANVARLRSGSGEDEVRELIGPPYRVDQYPRLRREVWTYKMYSGAMTEKDLYVQFSPDRTVREVMMVDDPEYSAHDHAH